MVRVPERLVEVWASPNGNVGCSGSGWVVGDRGVLTAWHVIREFEALQEFKELGGILQSRLATAEGTEDWFDCTVRWSDTKLDVALLEVVDSKWHPPESPCELADVGDHPLTCDVVGFPESEVRPEGDRETEHASGQLLTASGARSGHVPFDVASTTPESAEGWKGMSGALVRDQSRRLVALITDTHRDRDRRRLVATTIADVIAAKGSSEAFRDVGQKPQLAEPLGSPVATAQSPHFEVSGHRVTTIPEALPNGFIAWPHSDDLFKGHRDKLESARRRFGQRKVIPVHGPRYAGKEAFVRELLATRKVMH